VLCECQFALAHLTCSSCVRLHMGDANLVSAVADTPKMMFCSICSQIMTPSVKNGRMVYLCNSEQHTGTQQGPQEVDAADDNICVYKVRWCENCVVRVVPHKFFTDFARVPILPSPPRPAFALRCSGSSQKAQKLRPRRSQRTK
jgi:hypothetical protein